jgi:hypothetical protein
MDGCGKSDSPIVPVKPLNKDCGALQCAEKVEERGLTKGNLFSETSPGHSAGDGRDMVNPKTDTKRETADTAKGGTYIRPQTCEVCWSDTVSSLLGKPTPA